MHSPTVIVQLQRDRQGRIFQKEKQGGIPNACRHPLLERWGGGVNDPEICQSKGGSLPKTLRASKPRLGARDTPPNGLHGNKMPPGPGEAHAAPFGLVRPGSLGPIRDFSLTPGTAELIPCPQREKRKSTRV